MDGNIQKYLAFLRTVENGSFTRAAEILNYSQSSISKMIADLEKECGMSLMERGKSGIQLTPDGRELLPYIQLLCEDFRMLEHHVEEINGVQSGMIRIGTLPSMAIHWLPNIIHRFHEDYPNIEYELMIGNYTEIDQWIGEGRVDCGFVELPTRPEFDTIFLEKDEYKVIMNKNHPLAAKDTVDIEDLGGEPFIMLATKDNLQVPDILNRYHVQPNVVLTTWEDFAVMGMVERGFGVAIEPNLMLRRIDFQFEVRSLTEPCYRSMGLGFRSQKTASSAVKKFLQYLKYRDETLEERKQVE